MILHFPLLVLPMSSLSVWSAFLCSVRRTVV